MNADQQRTIERVQKLFALARNNPNAEEAMSARLKARRILIENGLDPNMFNEDMTSTMQLYDDDAASSNTNHKHQQYNRYQDNTHYQEAPQCNAYADQQTYTYTQAAEQPSTFSRIFKIFEPLLCWLLAAVILFLLVGMIWPWSIKSLAITIGVLFVLANIQYLFAIGFVLAIGGIVEWFLTR